MFQYTPPKQRTYMCDITRENKSSRSNGKIYPVINCLSNTMTSKLLDWPAPRFSAIRPSHPQSVPCSSTECQPAGVDDSAVETMLVNPILQNAPTMAGTVSVTIRPVPVSLYLPLDRINQWLLWLQSPMASSGRTAAASCKSHRALIRQWVNLRFAIAVL